MSNIKMEDYLAMEAVKSNIVEILKVRMVKENEEIDDNILNILTLTILRLENSIYSITDDPEKKFMLLMSYVVELWGSLMLEHGLSPDLALDFTEPEIEPEDSEPED
jgi:hypothetical protein